MNGAGKMNWINKLEEEKNSTENKSDCEKYIGNSVKFHKKITFYAE